MIGLVGVSEDDAVEAVVVVKLDEDREFQPCGIHRRNGCYMVGGSGDAEHSTSLHSSASSAYGITLSGVESGTMIPLPLRNSNVCGEPSCHNVCTVIPDSASSRV